MHRLKYVETLAELAERGAPWRQWLEEVGDVDRGDTEVHISATLRY